MDPKTWQIGRSIKLSVYWYDRVPEPPQEEVQEGEVMGWRDSQVLIRIPGYNVVRFWKKNGREVGNPDHVRRGWRISVNELNGTPVTAGIDIDV